MEFDKADPEEIIDMLNRALKTLEEKRKNAQLNIQQEVKMAKIQPKEKKPIEEELDEQEELDEKEE